MRHRQKWLRLGERIHPKHYELEYPRAAKAFEALRSNKSKVKPLTAVVENHIKDGDMLAAVNILSGRSGEFARRLDKLLRDSEEIHHAYIINQFARASHGVSTKILLQLIAHFRSGFNPLYRTFFPKGQIAKAYTIDNEKILIPEKSRDYVVSVCKEELINRFKALEPLGNVYIDPLLEGCNVPFAQRSMSDALVRITRGTKYPLDIEQGNTIRMFLYWMEGDRRVDIDLSACMFDSDFKYVGHVSYTNLRYESGRGNPISVHSGDITSAPDGACEFIDIDVDRFNKGVRYVSMNVYSYTQQYFKDVPVCFAGWMIRNKPNSNEIFEPKTVEQKIDLNGEYRYSIPVMFDLKTLEVIYCDLGSEHGRNIENSKKTSHALRGIIEPAKPTMRDLLELHVIARGKVVADKEDADIVFSLTDGITPFKDVDYINSELLV
jgi:stress response protein SCP2